MFLKAEGIEKFFSVFGIRVAGEKNCHDRINPLPNHYASDSDRIIGFPASLIFKFSRWKILECCFAFK